MSNNFVPDPARVTPQASWVKVHSSVESLRPSHTGCDARKITAPVLLGGLLGNPDLPRSFISGGTRPDHRRIGHKLTTRHVRLHQNPRVRVRQHHHRLPGPQAAIS